MPVFTLKGAPCLGEKDTNLPPSVNRMTVEGSSSEGRNDVWLSLLMIDGVAFHIKGTAIAEHSAVTVLEVVRSRERTLFIIKGQ